jgi:hypothetical protein
LVPSPYRSPDITRQGGLFCPRISSSAFFLGREKFALVVLILVSNLPVGNSVFLIAKQGRKGNLMKWREQLN